MITHYIDGTTIGSEYTDAVKADNRDFLARFMLNGSEVNCGIQRVEFTTGSCGNIDQFTIGSVIGNSMVAEVLDLTDDVKNKTLELQIGLLINGVYRWIRVGEYKISEVKKKINGATLTGFGRVVSNSSGTFIEPANKTLNNIVNEIASEIGGSVYIDPAINRTRVITEPMAGLTTYQAIQVIASVIGGYAVDRPVSGGGVNFLIYKDTPTYSVNSGLMTTLPDLEEQDFEITGIQCIVSESSTDGETPAEGYSQGTPINIMYNCKHETQDIFTNAATNLIGYTYRPGSINLSLGDPRLLGSDVLEVTDADGSIYTVPCHSIRHIYDGGFRSEIQAASATHIENSIGTVAPLQQQKKDTDQQFVEVEAEIENLADGIQYFWYNDDGAHVSTISKKRYEETRPGQVCVEVLITSTNIIFRRGSQGSQGGWYWTIYATYSNSGIELGDYASMTDSGIVLGDINDTNYQLVLDPTQGLLLNNIPIIVSDYATAEITETTTTKRICAGLINDDSTVLYFTVPLECILPEGLSVNITTLKANFKIDGTSYFLDGSYYSGGYTWLGSNYTVRANVAGTAMTISITKNSTFKKHGTSTAVDAYSSITCEIDQISWTKPAINNRELNIIESNNEETIAIDPPNNINR